MFNIIKNIYSNYKEKKSKVGVDEYIRKIDDNKKLYRSFFMDNSGCLNTLGKKILIDLMEETKLFHNINDKEEIISRERNRYILYYILSMLYDDYNEIYKELIKEANYE